MVSWRRRGVSTIGVVVLIGVATTEAGLAGAALPAGAEVLAGDFGAGLAFLPAAGAATASGALARRITTTAANFIAYSVRQARPTRQCERAATLSYPG